MSACRHLDIGEVTDQFEGHLSFQCRSAAAKPAH
jgi:hypothetical protein